MGRPAGASHRALSESRCGGLCEPCAGQGTLGFHHSCWVPGAGHRPSLPINFLICKRDIRILPGEYQDSD